jgi:murein DD-endopeptidase MepM/ murein hydrolase activator NlpD
MRLLSIAALVFLLTACQPAVETLTPLPFFPTYTPAAQVSATATTPATPTAGVTTIPQVLPSPISSPSPIPPITAEPLIIEYPTQESSPIPAWRPPLYPVPWAPTPFDHFYFVGPIAANVENTRVGDYRYGGVFFQDVVHTGVDIPAAKGTPVLASGPGTVVWAGYGIYRGGYDPTDPYGMVVTIRHDFGYQNQMLYTIYGHLDQIDVVEGQHLATGDALGLVGETGKVTGPHLHFEVRVGENSFFTTRNPELWLVPPMGWGVIAGRLTNSADQPISGQMIIITNPESEENWFAWTYGETSVNSDPYYRENMVIGNMPEGTYLIRIAYGGVNFTKQIEVHPGVVNYFTFRGFDGISIEAPPTPGADFTPEPLENPAP